MRCIVILFFSFITVHLAAQEADEVYDDGKMRLLGFNMTEMVTQFMPFADRLDQTGPFAFKYMGGRKGNLFNFQIGADKVATVDDPFSSFGSEDVFVNIEFGYARLKKVNEKFYHYFSQNMMVSSGFLNQPGEQLLFFNDGFIALNAGWGVGYMLSDMVSISTEIQFIFSVGDFGDGGKFQFIPPIGLFLVTHL